jgi:hypothetical protein
LVIAVEPAPEEAIELSAAAVAAAVVASAAAVALASVEFDELLEHAVMANRAVAATSAVVRKRM